MQSVSTNRWETKSELLAHLNAVGSQTLVLGLDTEAPRNFYSISISFDGETIEIGIFASGFGIEPAVALLDDAERAIIGHDKTLTWIDLRKVSVLKSYQLYGPFYEFLSLNRDDEIIVLHELGALRVNADGDVRWTVDTGVVVGSRTEAGNLVLTIMDEDSPIIVSLDFGRTTRSTHVKDG